MTLGVTMILLGVATVLTTRFTFSVPFTERSGLTYWVLGGGKDVGLNTSVLWLMVVLAAVWIIIFRTAYGNRLLAVGGAAQEAASLGVSCLRTKLVAFAASGNLAGFAGVLEAGKLGFVDSSMGRNMDLQAIAACVLGGCALMGGRVSPTGVIGAGFVLSSVQSYLVVMGVRPQWFVVFLGCIIVAAAFGVRVMGDWASFAGVWGLSGSRGARRSS
jgi:simple sugar transport system permease protein/ribose transport system permease protein